MHYRIDNKFRKPTFIIFLLLIALFILSRSVYLERDLPSTVISSYVAIDELYYTIPAFNLYHYGETIHNIVPFLSEDLQPINIMENTFTFFTLSLFGNNYYGLRMASVLAALIIFVLLYLILKKIVNGNMQEEGFYEVNNLEKRNYVLYFVMAYLLCDFSFLMAGRVAEPTIFRILALVVVIYIGTLPSLFTKLESKGYSMLLGFLALAAVVFVYVYNAFIFCALAVSVFLWAYKSGLKNAVKQSTFFLLGTILCLLTYQLFIDVTYNSSLAEVIQHLIPYQNRMGVGVSHTARIESYLLNTIFLFLTNVFRFNIILLLIFLVSLPVFFKKLKTEYNNFDILIFNLMVFLIMQSIVINDYPLRKLIILLPIAAILMTTSYVHFIRHLAEFVSSNKGRRFVNLAWFSAFVICLAVTALYFSPKMSGDSVSILGKFMYLNLGVFLTINLVLLLKHLSLLRIPKAVTIVCLVLMLIPNLYLDSKYVFFNRTFHFRDAMISMSEKVDGKIIVGGCSYGFRLYNKSIPIWDFYRYNCSSSERQLQYNVVFDRMFAEGIGSYSIAYTDEMPDAPIGQTFMSQHGLQLEEEFELGENLDCNLGLYSPK